MTNKLNYSLVFIPLTIISIIIVGVTVWATNKNIQATQGYTPSIENKTQLFHLVEINDSGGTTRLLFRNDYHKNINAFQLSLDHDARQIELIYADDVERQTIAPGGTFQYSFPAPSGRKVQKISIQTVVFEDGSSDGDPVIGEQIQDMHQGIKTQYKKFLPLLKSILDSPDADTEEALNRFESQVSKLSSGDESSALTIDFKFGLQSAKESIINEIQKVKFAKRKHVDVSIRNALLKVKEKHEKRLAKL